MSGHCGLLLGAGGHRQDDWHAIGVDQVSVAVHHVIAVQVGVFVFEDGRADDVVGGLVDHGVGVVGENGNHEIDALVRVLWHPDLVVDRVAVAVLVPKDGL